MARESSTKQIYNYVRDQILLGRWEMGEKLNDLEIAEEIQVSRLSVREALFRLIETGIIEKIHWKGYFIKVIDEQIISDIIQLRVILESEAVQNLITDGTEKDFAEMEQAINMAEELLNKNDLLNLLHSDYHFHELLHSCQHNSCIVDTMKKYSIAIHFVIYITIGKDENYIETLKYSTQEHRLILEALKSRDKELATNRIVAHLSRHEQHAKDEFPAFKPHTTKHKEQSIRALM